MIHFHPMTEAEFSEYKPFLIENYAQSIAHNYRLSLEEARASSAKQINTLLSQGLATPHQLLYELCLGRGAPEERIGYLWLDVDETKQRCFIYDIYLLEAFRSQGWGRKTLELLEGQLAERKIQRIGLSVFAQNKIARDLYLKLGYEVTGLNMQKWLAAQ